MAAATRRRLRLGPGRRSTARGEKHRRTHTGTAFYATAHARRCTADEIDEALRTVNHRAIAQGIGEFTSASVTTESRLRFYVAEITEAWVLDQDAEVDQRAPVPR